MASPADESPRASPSGAPLQGIPEEAVGSPELSDEEADSAQRTPLADLPAVGFWDALYGRRSIRRFKPDPVPRELIDQVMHAGIWAPSSCNYQMWDLVAVDDAAVNERLAALSLQMGNAPVNIVVSYGRDFSEENWANIQSASALIQNMSLAAQVLGLGTFWITQTGDRERVREIVGLPRDRLVVAVLALGYPKTVPAKGPKRRPLSQVTHYNHYAGRPIPSSVDPEDWEPDLLAIYQRARVLNGLRHNKPRSWEVRALTECLDRLVPGGRERPVGESQPPRWLDVLACTGVVVERLSRERPGFAFDVAERTPEVARWSADRARPKGRALAWPEPRAGFPGPAPGAYEVVSCLYRLEDLGRAERQRLAADVARWLAPGGHLLLGFVNARSYHDVSERLRSRRGGPGGVEYVLSPDPNVGPFQPLVPREVEALFTDAGLELVERLGLQAVPPPDEIDFRARNFSARTRRLTRSLGKGAALADKMGWVRAGYGRFQYRLFRK